MLSQFRRQMLLRYREAVVPAKFGTQLVLKILDSGSSPE